MNKANDLTFTMANQGFVHVPPYSRALLVHVIYDDAGLIYRMLVLGIPLTAIKMLAAQNVFHFERARVSEHLLIAIDEYYERHKHEVLQSVWDKYHSEVEKGPKLVQ